VDAFSRRIVGWRVAGHMRTDMVLDALKMALRSDRQIEQRHPAEPVTLGTPAPR